MPSIPWWVYVIIAGLAWGTYVPIIFYGGTELTTKPGTIGGRLASILCVGIAYFVMAVVIPVVLMGLREDAKPEWKSNGLVFSALAGIAGAVGAICVIFASKAAVDEAKGEFEKREAALVKNIEDEPSEFEKRETELLKKIKDESNPEPKAALESELKEFRAAREPHKAALESELNEFRAGRASYMATYRVFIAPLIFALAPAINTLLSLVWHPKPGDPWHFGFEVPGWKLPVGILLVAIGTFLVLKSKEDMEAAKGGPKPPPAPTAPADGTNPNPAPANGS